MNAEDCLSNLYLMSQLLMSLCIVERNPTQLSHI